MSSTTEIIRLITIFVGIPVFVCGVIGNLLNIRLLWPTRHNPCAFIFLSASLINCVVLFYGLFTRILSVGFALDWSSTNLIWCKTRAAFSTASFLMSITCVCLASIDRFLASYREEKYRKFSRLSFARWAVLGTIIFWLAHSIPELVYLQLVTSPYTGLITCSSIAPNAFNNYRIYFSLPFYIGILLIGTGLLTYRNTKTLQMSRQREVIQRQLTTMLLIQISINVFSTLPYRIFTLVFYTSFATSFFV